MKKIDRSKHYLLALSGGVDSTYLFYQLLKNGYNFSVCHVNHHTRGCENLVEQNFCAELCERFDKRFHVVDFYYDVGNFHAQARLFRFDTYLALIQKYGYDAVLLAHHQDDIVENIIMDPRGLRSKLIKDMVMINGVLVVRPLLEVFKSDIIKYMEFNNYSFCMDSSNLSNKYLRNSVRNSNVLDEASKLRLISDEKLRVVGFKCDSELEVSELLSSSDPRLLLYNFIKSQVEKQISYRFIDMVLSSDLSVNKSFVIGDNLSLELSYQLLLVVEYREYSNTIQKLARVNVYNDVYFEYDKPVENLFVTRADNYQFIAKNGFRKKVAREMIDLKIPVYLRPHYPVIIDCKRDIVSIPFYKRRKMLYEENLKEIIVNKQELMQGCDRLRLELEADYKDVDGPIIFLGLLKGCNPFMTDLLRDINLRHICDYMNVSSYFGQEKAISDVQIIMDMTVNVRDQHVVIVEDIVDSGRTIKKVMELLEFRGAKSIEIVTCLDKPSGRTVELEPKYIGHEVPDAFLVGYGLDYKDEYRNITCVAILDEKAID